MSEKQRRSRGEGTVYWDEQRQRYMARQTVGYDGRGKPIRKTGSGKTESAALKALRARVREYEAGILPDARRVTVSAVVEDWLAFARSSVSARTQQGNEIHYLLHIKPHLGGRRVRDLRPDEIDRWLVSLAPKLSTSTLKQVRSVLKRSIDRAMKRGLAERNVVDLSPAPKGRPGRRSRSLTFQQASDLLDKTRDHPAHAYIVVSLLAGARPEEVRALRWDAVDLDPPKGVPPHINVWRSVREGGDTKTQKSRRTLAISGYVAAVLIEHRAKQAAIRARAGDAWKENDLVFPSLVGTEQDSHNVRRSFRSALRLVPGIVPEEWTPRDLRHSFVSILSERGLPIEEISRLMGHSGTAVTELVYRHELRPVLEAGAAVMDLVFPVLKADGADDDDAA
ncbi:site-specific integrase [Isoptericola cucumis]|uniref:Integrase n=1 Tax=Isoptericola cucumis TaxID=1776856 RepID=A0ABQ2B662_9MICO|nr:site-specific integrase [Isoptericola cucumis]GGI07523.1 integrase [Isoptericola cucumis]